MNFDKFKDMMVDLGFEGEDISAATNFAVDLDLDSTEMVELSVAIERNFKVKISYLEIKELKTIEAVLGFIQTKAA